MTDHLSIGVLAGLIHRDIVDDVIRECGKREKRQRLLPAHVVMYYVLALNLFFGEAYEEVLRQLVNGLKFLGNWRGNWDIPSTSALSQARTRLGEAPMKRLFERIAVPMARPGTRGAWYRGLRVMAIDGLVLDVVVIGVVPLGQGWCRRGVSSFAVCNSMVAQLRPERNP